MSDHAEKPSPSDQPETVDAGGAHPGRRVHKEPESIGSYRILEKIGEGGMGIVYKAEQREPVRRIVALKVIKLGMDTKEVVARFEAERQALAMLSHPNVARVFEAGITASGTPFFAMEHVPGVPLTDYCNQNKLTTRQRLELFIPVCQAIQHAHQKGIIHRDLKPSNVLVQMFDGRPIPKVIDFGIAKATNSALTQHTLFTQTGAMVGTPEYMSPEQAMTSGLDVDTRTDIYSLGVVLYELLTGMLPFDPKTLRGAGMQAMAQFIRETEPQKPSTRLTTMPGDMQKDSAERHHTDTRTLKREISGDLDWITLKAMEKDRTRRYETANGLAMDIQRHLDDEPVTARPPSTAYRLSKFVRKHRAGVIAGTVVAGALVVAIVGTSVGWIQTRAALHRAEKAEAAATEERNRVTSAQAATEKEARRARAANDFMRNMLSSARPNDKQGAGEAKVADVLDNAAQALDRLKDQPELELDGRLTLASTFYSLNAFQKSVDNYNRALTLSRTLTGLESEQSIQITTDLLFVMGKANDAVSAEVLARQNVEAARRIFGEHHAVTHDALNSLGIILLTLGRRDQGEELFRGLIREAETQPSVKSPKGTARYYNNLSVIVSQKGRTAEAERLQRQAIELFKTESIEGIRKTGVALSNLASNLASQNKLAEAADAYRQAVDEYRKALGNSHPETLGTISNLILILEQKGDFAGSLALRKEIGRFAREANLANADSPYMPFIIGELMVRAGEDEKPARDSFQKALELFRKLAPQSESVDQAARRWWAHANLFLGLRVDRQWTGKGVQAQASHTAWNALFNFAPADLSLDLIDWEAMRFKIEPWPPGPPPIEGGRKELWTLADPAPGVYLFSIALPRRGGKPIREARWMLVTQWKVELYVAPDMDLSDIDKAKALFASDPVERRTESVLVLDRFGMANYGLGPSHRLNEFALAATTRGKLPEGRYRLRLFADGSRRALIDRKTILNAWNSTADSAEIFDTTASPPADLRIEWAMGGNGLLVTCEPISPEADKMWTAARGALADLEISLERLDRKIAGGSAPAATYYDRGMALGRMGRLKEAAEDFVKATELDPSDHFRWYERACVLAALQDKERYRDTCKAMLERFKDADRPEVLERTSKAALLWPEAFDDVPLLQKRIDRALATGTEYIHWFQLTKALAEYRAGKERYDAALEMIATSRPKHDVVGPAAATCDLISAMILFKSGKPEEARTLLENAEMILSRIGNTPGVDDLGRHDLENRLIYNILHREAEAMISHLP